MAQLICSLGTLAVAILGIAVLVGIIPRAKAFYALLRGALTLGLAVLAVNVARSVLTPALLSKSWSALRSMLLVTVVALVAFLTLMLILHLLSKTDRD